MLKMGFREAEILAKSRGEIEAYCSAFNEMMNGGGSAKKYVVKKAPKPGTTSRPR